MEYDGIPGVDSSLSFPWWRHGWYGACAYHVRPRPQRVWSPVSWDEGDYCREVLARDPCAYCGGPVEVIDHIEPSGHGGDNDTTNLIGACRACNASKTAKPLLLFLLTRDDPRERIERRIHAADIRYDRALMRSIDDVGRLAYYSDLSDARRVRDAARADLEHAERFAA